MSAGIVTRIGRGAAERLMQDQCTITRTSVTHTDPETGAQIKTIAPVYTGKCRIQMQMPGSASAVEPGEAHLLLLSLSVQIPMSVTGVQPGDIVTVTSSVLDAELNGRRFRVKDLGHKTHGTSRRLGVTEVT